MATLMRTLHIGLQVADAARSIAFYTALGYEVLGEVRATGFGGLTMLQLPGEEFVSIELVNDPAGSPTGRSGPHHFVVGVDDVHTHVDRLADQGFRAEAPTSPDDSDDFWTAWLTDPDGHRIELVQWPPGHPAGMTQADLTSSERVPGEPAQSPMRAS